MEGRPRPMAGVGSWRAGARPNRLSVIGVAPNLTTLM